MSDTSADATRDVTDSPTDSHPSSEPATTVQRVAAEVLGTFLLVFLGCGAIVMTTLTDAADFLAIALAFGFALAVASHAFGRISGGHFNPAVSLAAAISGRLSWVHAALYAGAQLVGAVVGAAVLFLVTLALPDGSLQDDFLGQNFFGDGGFEWWGALVLELVLTAVLVTVYLAVTDERNVRTLAPLSIGLSLAVLYLVTVPLTGGSLNPARAIGPALFTGTDALKDLWLFVLVPLVAAAGAGLAYPALFGRDNEAVAGSGLTLSRPPRAATAPGQGGGYAPQGQAYPQQGGYAPQGQAYPQQGGYAPQGQAYPQQGGYPQQGQAAPGYDTQAYGTAAQAQPAWGHGGASAVQQPVYEPEPIIQDGWQWDHQAQEWKPLEQWPAPTHAAQPAQAATGAGDPLDADTTSTDLRRSQQPGPDVSQEPWPGDDQTVMRPRQP